MKAGDTTVMANPGWYIDTSKMPANYIEWRNLMNEQKEKVRDAAAGNQKQIREQLQCLGSNRRRTRMD
jgi:hypothetical protein